jgi:hypothetical protein
MCDELESLTPIASLELMLQQEVNNVKSMPRFSWVRTKTKPVNESSTDRPSPIVIDSLVSPTKRNKSPTNFKAVAIPLTPEPM